MSGHNRWGQIRHKKGISDQKRGQLFSKLAKVIAVAARKGANPDTNSELKTAIDRARDFNMPKENIEKAIKKAGEKGSAALNQVIIQAIGPGSVAIVIEAITENKNRTINEIKNILAKNGAKPVPEGSLNWLFDPVRGSPPKVLRTTRERAGETSSGVEKNWTPKNPLSVTDAAILAKIDKLFEELDDHGDVEEVYSNLP